MPTALEDFSFGKKWTDIHTDSYEGYAPRISDYHMHTYYEITMILSGNVNVLLSDTMHSGTQPRMVLLRPYAPHYITCKPDLLYSRRNTCFRADILADCDPQWQALLNMFGKNGSVLMLSSEQCSRFTAVYEALNREQDGFRKKLLLLYYLSLISEAAADSGEYARVPGYVTEALSYISTQYAQRIVAGELAAQLGTGRTTLMTAFKQHTGITVNEYLARCRLKHAVTLLQSGISEQETAERCGFSDVCSLIRCFRRIFGMPPRKYIQSLNAADKNKQSSL